MTELTGINSIIDKNIPHMLSYTVKYINHLIYTEKIMHSFMNTTPIYIPRLRIHLYPWNLSNINNGFLSINPDRSSQFHVKFISMKPFFRFNHSLIWLGDTATGEENWSQHNIRLWFNYPIYNCPYTKFTSN